MFADVSGSTEMYEQLGDTVAHTCVSESLSRIAQHADDYNGTLVETIGDEAMLTFVTVSEAASAAIAMQKHFQRSPVLESHTVRIRVGFHFGIVDYHHGHPFGDTVNVAARVASLCEPDRIIATRSSIRYLSQEDCPACLSIRQYQTTLVKGKSKPLVIEEVVWNTADATSVFDAYSQTVVNTPEAQKLYLRLNQEVIKLTPQMGPFVIGRGDDCDHMVCSPLVSRAHLKLEFLANDWQITDHSTNGTFISYSTPNLSNRAKTIRLHRQSRLLTGQGIIAMGSFKDNADSDCLISYELRS
ncbi:FHA domain-containing protein [Ketobacter sp. MCCC 1A13808]|uniref:adenylate/guanylate cyclase domain-containing protein n=1 Tax=Ketobacter sp. MCCC 1A13808 TaxID=2602738 RepID=UPI000F2A25AD|nr:adenylate/guanylate cyclase domain-containing protein [Ketobacter sp. MCCC 1A13808]MVF12396.1 FHA domain-containing protein [Ketobacter sp. MCCC 1A13808]RLP55788.1 MAG: FHA domain-containing protein [Ketobacter sp.]